MAKPNLADTIRDTKSRVQADEQSRPVHEKPMYARLERKEVRVRADQLEALTTLTRSLMRARRTKGERITENTLIRIAIDLLLAHQGVLRGGTEEQLRNSVTSGPPHSQNSDLRKSRTPGVPGSATPDLSNSGTSGYLHFESPGTSIGGPR